MVGAADVASLMVSVLSGAGLGVGVVLDAVSVLGWRCDLGGAAGAVSAASSVLSMEFADADSLLG